METGVCRPQACHLLLPLTDSSRKHSETKRLALKTETLEPWCSHWTQRKTPGISYTSGLTKWSCAQGSGFLPGQQVLLSSVGHWWGPKSHSTGKPYSWADSTASSAQSRLHRLAPAVLRHCIQRARWGCGGGTVEWRLMVAEEEQLCTWWLKSQKNSSPTPSAFFLLGQFLFALRVTTHHVLDSGQDLHLFGPELVCEKRGSSRKILVSILKGNQMPWH